MVIRRFDVWLVQLDPTIGNEIQKIRPAVVVSPDEMNRNSTTIIIAPLTSSERSLPTRVPCVFKHKNGMIALDQIRTVDTLRLIEKSGVIDMAVGIKVLRTLRELFEL